MPIKTSTNDIVRISDQFDLITCVKTEGKIVHPRKAGFGCRGGMTVAYGSTIAPDFGNYKAYGTAYDLQLTGINEGDPKVTVAKQLIGGRWVPYLYVLSDTPSLGLSDCFLNVTFPSGGGTLKWACGIIRAGETPQFGQTYTYGGAGVTYYNVKVSGLFAGFGAVAADSMVYPFLFDVTSSPSATVSGISWAAGAN